jgi:hypothetical protein
LYKYLYFIGECRKRENIRNQYQGKSEKEFGGFGEERGKTPKKIFINFLKGSFDEPEAIFLHSGTRRNSKPATAFLING